MEGLILLSHGSLLCGASETVRRHAERLSRRKRYGVVAPAFLNYNRPTFDDAAKECVEAGATRITVLPYFLISGRFVVRELPSLVRKAGAAYAQVEFTIADPIGYQPLMADIILKLAEDAKQLGNIPASGLLFSDTCERNPSCPLYGSKSCLAVAGEPSR